MHMEKVIQKKGKQVTRRNFLKGFGGGALGAAVVPKWIAQESSVVKTSEGEVPLYSLKKITLTVNGLKCTLIVEPQETLLEALREGLNMTGTKKTCGRGECGGCTVLVDGEPVYSCMFLAFRADGKQVTTIEGLAPGSTLHPVQQAFIDKDGYQCGFCTPGMILSSVALLNKNPNPDTEEIKKELAGNLCRCGNYTKIFEAVAEAAKNMRGS